MTEQTTVRMSLIFPDPNQPRKYFDTVKLDRLKQSITKYGLQQPLVVEKQDSTHYKLIDGERRYRACTELGIKEVPVIVTEVTGDLDRLIKQFHIQEQHEGWTMTEKANAVIDLAAALKLPLPELCKELGLERQDAERLISYAQLIEKKQFAKAELPMEQASHIRRLKEATKKIYQNATEEEFDRTAEKSLEKALITRAEQGILRNSGDYSKLRDAFRKDPNTIEKFMTDETATPDSLFIKSKAKGTYHLRNAVNAARTLANHITDYMKIGDVLPTDDDKKMLKFAKIRIEELLSATN